MSIAMTGFAAGRHFDPEFAGTKITNMTPEQFIQRLMLDVNAGDAGPVVWSPGYAPFCKHVFVPNFTDALMGVAEITEANRGLLEVGYKARRPEELPVLESWFNASDLGEIERAAWLDVIVYDRAQMEAEGIELPLGAEWGIVAILSAPTPEEAPMKPITMMRNALGKDQGGSGAPLDEDAYRKAVDYWSRWATIR
jgi:hypothetical protein